MSLPTEKKRVFIVAGEASGDMLGAGLIESLRYFYGERLEFAGVGGEKMKEQGFHSVFPMEDIALMGFAEVLPHAWNILCRMKQTCEALMEFHPDILVTIDSPGFNFRLLEWVKKYYGSHIPCIHYVAPSVWAYKPKRAAKTNRLCDHLLTILPFENRYFEAYGLKTTFVGHPVVDDLGIHYVPPRPYNTGEPLRLAVFPGSRKGEIKRFLPIFRDTVEALKQYYPAVEVSIPINEMVLPYLDVSDWKEKPALVLGAASRLKVMQNSHIALAKTGTVTLEIAKHGLPMVASYKVNPVTAALIKRMLNIPYVNLINIIAGYEVIPELMQEECNPQQLCNALRRLIDSPEQMQQQSAASMSALSLMRNPDGVMASDVAAHVVLSYLR